MKKTIILFFTALFVFTSCTQKEEELNVLTILKVTNISFDSIQVVIGINESLTLTLKQTPANLPAPLLTWVSLSPDIATVDANGVVKGVSIGIAKIKVSNQSDQSISSTCNVIVKIRGTSELPYLIYTVQDLIQMRDRLNNDNSNYGNKVYKLMSDLDFSNEASWLPIGNSDTTPFTGIFDGNNKIIKKIRIGTQNSSVSLTNAGLFGKVSGGDIRNLSVQWTNLSSTNGNAGGIIGLLLGGTITNCNSSGNIINSYSIAGGIVGSASNSTITNCYSTGNITSQSTSGGIAGTLSSGTVNNCYATGDITTSDGPCAGGIGGSSSDCCIINSYSTGIISSTSSSSTFGSYYYCLSGGISGSGGCIINCYSTGNINCSSIYVYPSSGGIAGAANGSIINCYTTSNINSTSTNGYTSLSGGIAGCHSNVMNCIALNSSIVSISNNDSYACRIGCFLNATSSNNYAASTIILKKGTSSNNLTNVTSFTNAITDGVSLKSNPVDLLNAYVTANPTVNGVSLSKWKVDPSINNGNPIFQ